MIFPIICCISVIIMLSIIFTVNFLSDKTESDRMKYVISFFGIFLFFLDGIGTFACLGNTQMDVLPNIATEEQNISMTYNELSQIGYTNHDKYIHVITNEGMKQIPYNDAIYGVHVIKRDEKNTLAELDVITEKGGEYSTHKEMALIHNHDVPLIKHNISIANINSIWHESKKQKESLKSLPVYENTKQDINDIHHLIDKTENLDKGN